MAEANRSKPLKLDSTIGTLLAPNGVDWPGKAQVVGLHLTNAGATDCWVDIAVQRSGVDYYLLFQKIIPANDPLFLTTHLILETGDLLRGRGQVQNQVHAVISGIADVV